MPVVPAAFSAADSAMAEKVCSSLMQALHDPTSAPAHLAKIHWSKGLSNNSNRRSISVANNGLPHSRQSAGMRDSFIKKSLQQEEGS